MSIWAWSGDLDGCEAESDEVFWCHAISSQSVATDREEGTGGPSTRRLPSQLDGRRAGRNYPP